MNEPTAMPPSVRSVAEVATPHASRYLQQLCKHFAHRRPVTFDERSGQIGFDSGDCHLDAREGVLRLSLAPRDDAQIAQLQDVVVRHLVRFAFREELKIDWQPVNEGGK